MKDKGVAKSPKGPYREPEERGVDTESLKRKYISIVKIFAFLDNSIYISIALISSLKAVFLLILEFLLIL